MSKKNKSIKSKIILLSISIALISLVIIPIIAGIFIQVTIIRIKTNDFKLIANNLSDGINSHMDFYKSLVTILVNNPEVMQAADMGNKYSEEKGYVDQNIDSLENIYNPLGNSMNINNNVVSIFKTYISEYKSIKEIFITNKYGHNVEVSHKTSDFVQSDEEWWQKAWEKGVYIEDVEYDESSKSMSFTICAVIPHPETGEKNGVIKTAVDFTDIYKLLVNSQIGKTGEAYLVNKDKFMITESRFKDELIKKELIKDTAVLNIKVESFAVNQAEEGNEGYKHGYKGYQDITVSGYYKPLSINNWSLIIEQNVKEASKDIVNFIISIIIFGVTLLIIIIIVSFIFSKSIADPIRLLTEGAQRFAMGDINMHGINESKINRIKNRNDELGRIINAFYILIDYLKEKISVSQKIADGDLKIDVNIASDADELGIAMSNTVTSLNNLLSQVNLSVDQVTTGSSQVSNASQTLSQGATEQASSLEEITSSITEINSQAKQNAKNAEIANELSIQAKDSAVDGNKMMQKLVEAMFEINESSSEIKKVVKVIDDIAFQTNLLALNANVEAARAGKYGKGFAVVAEEVRNLASRSAESVKETTVMVEDTLKKIFDSNELVDQTSAQLTKIVSNIEEVVALVCEIALASNEQSQGLDQINLGLGQIDQVTQSNTANAEESASASEELASQANLLKLLVNKFKLKQMESNLNMKNQLAFDSKNESTEIINDKQIADIYEEDNKIQQKKSNHKDIDIKKINNIDDDNFGKF